MSLKNIDKKDYILVEPPEAEYWEILQTFGSLLKVADYPNKNIIWDFRNALLKPTYDELYKIKDWIKEKYPENAKSDRKVALVVEGGLNLALAKEYIRIANELPPEFNIFPDLDSAKDWIKQ